jgi:hypothetical protein
MAITVNSDLTLIAADKVFIDLINNRITMYGEIPYTIPQKLIIEIIKESARYFFRHYYRATHKTFYHLLIADIKEYLHVSNLTEQGLVDYVVTLPSYVNVVEDIWECDSVDQPTSQELIENIQLLQRAAPYGQSILGINNNLYIEEACVRMIEEQNYTSIFGTSVPFHYNNLNHQLNIHKLPNYNLVLKIWGNVDIQLLYRDDLFIRYVIGRCKQELKRKIAGHTIELPGGVTLNADEICNNIEDVEKVEEQLKTSGGIGDLILER